FFIVFACRCIRPRDPPSFPTRRSSDLLPRAAHGCEGSGRCCFVCPKDAKQAVHLNYLQRARDNGARIVVEARARKFNISGTRVQDRKSTRLNSSHVKISYAVFCLKKKT